MTDSVQRLLVVCDEDGDPTASFSGTSPGGGYVVDTARGVQAACVVLSQHEFSVMVADLSAADDAALAVVRAARRSPSTPRALLLLPQLSFDAPLALALMREGAYVYLRHPVDLDELDELIATACAEVDRARPAGSLDATGERTTGASRSRHARCWWMATRAGSARGCARGCARGTRWAGAAGDG